MQKTTRRAGQNIRDLAFRRRVKAIYLFASAFLIASLPFLFIKIFEPFLRTLTTLNPSQPKTLELPFYLYVFCFAIAIALIFNGSYLWKRAKHAAQGAKGEEDTAQAMAELEQEGWQIEYGLRLGQKLGDVDIVCVSPQQQAFVIDVKSHRGEVSTDGKKLIRRMGNSTYQFEKDFLVQAMKQAMQVKQQKQYSFVTPIVAFSDAKVSVPLGKLRGVYVVDKSRLVTLLRSLSK